MNATATQARRVQPGLKGLSPVKVTVPRATLEVATTFADHFQLAPEVVMEAQVYMELEAFGDDTFSTLIFAASRPAMEGPVEVELMVFDEIAELVGVVARLLNRPDAWLWTLLVQEGVDLIRLQMADAEKQGDIRGNTDMQDAAEAVFRLTLDARAGRFPKTGECDAWAHLNLDRDDAWIKRMEPESKTPFAQVPLDAEVARVLGDFCSAAGVEVVDFLNQWVGSTVCDTFTLSRTRDGFLEGAAGDLLREWRLKEKDRPAVAAKMWEIIRRENAAKVKFTASAIAARRKAAAKGGKQ